MGGKTPKKTGIETRVGITAVENAKGAANQGGEQKLHSASRVLLLPKKKAFSRSCRAADAEVFSSKL